MSIPLLKIFPPTDEVDTDPQVNGLALGFFNADGSLDDSGGTVDINLDDTQGKNIALQTLSDGSVVLASPDFKGGAGQSLYMFIGFAVPNGATAGSGQQTINGSPNGTLQTLIMAAAWNPSWTQEDHPVAGQPRVYVALPEHLRDTISSAMVPGLVGLGSVKQVDYSGYNFAAITNGNNQQRTAHADDTSLGLPDQTQWIDEPYKWYDTFWAAPAFTNINVQIASGDPVTAATVASGGATAAYCVGNVLTVTGGTGSACVLTVTAVSAGLVTAVSIANGGAYSAVPANPVSVTGAAGTGATVGAGATFNLVFTAVALRDVNMAGRNWASI